MTDENNAALGEGSERRREADGEVAGNRRRSGRSDKFNKLPPLDIEELGGMHKSLELGHKDDRNVFRGGVLPNGLRYFIRRNKHPKRRCALALAVKAGSVHEEDSEQGVAHILEHLAFRSTKRFNNYDIVKFLESIGADFGADQNAYTAFDETVYELFVPCEKEEEEEEEEKEEESTARKTDNTKSEKEEEEGSDGDRNMPTLERALLVLSEFANGIRADPEDLETERGTVLEEWRQSRNNQSRMVESHWKATMKGSKYESRLPIGLEKVIREVTSDEVKEFRDKWYTPNHMGVILVGDFAQNIGEIEKMVVKAFDSAPQSSDGTDNYLNVNVPVHEQPQYLIMTDEEATASSVNISFVKPIDYGEGNGDETWNLSTYREMLVEDMFDTAMNSILFRRSHGSTSEKQPFFSASFGNDHVCRNADHASFTARCKSGGTLEAIESLLIELARIRTRGFERREIEAARIQLLSDAETSYVESGKAKSEDLRDEYLGHFLRGEPVLDIVTEARINVMLLKDIKAEEVQALASRYTHSKGMVIQTIEPPNDGVRRTKEDIAKIVEKVGRMEMNREIGKHPDDDKRMSPEDLLPEEALNYQNSVRFQHDIKSYPALEAKQTVLSNGMSVCWRRSTLNDDQVLVYAFARGGLSQEIKGVEGDPSVAEMLKLRTASIGSLFASDVGVFGVKPWLLSDALAGIRCGISPNVRGYMRSFGGEQSSSDFETSLRLIHLLFKTEVKVIDSELATLKQMVRESIQNQIRDPVTKYAQRLKFVNYGKSFYFRPWTLSEFESIDAHKSCKYFSGCFENPGQFTLIIIGDIDEISGAGTDKDFLEMLEKYVGSIEVKDASANTPVDIKDLVPIPFSQPSQIHRETVIAKMVDPMSATQVTFPVGIRKVPYETALADSFWICFCCNLLEQRLMHQMRFARGEIYSVSVSPSFAVESPSFPFEVVRGDVVIAFSCEPGGSADSLITLALDEVQNLRTKPAMQEEIDSLLEVEKRSYEVAMEDNSFWQDCLITAHQSRMYRETKDLDKAYLFRKKIRDEVLSTINPETMMKHFRDFFKSREECIYSAITLEPDSSVSFASRCLSSIYNHIPSLELTSSLSQSKLLLAGSLAAAAVAAGALYYIRHSKA